jgi:NAD(P)-dependent dehydrogenase (short-subunit alcohol dehydrogenase family)
MVGRAGDQNRRDPLAGWPPRTWEGNVAMSSQGVAAVTGGASGIGAACCRELARQGFTVAVLDRNGDLATEVANEIGGRARAMDVADDVSVERTAAWVEDEIGPVTALVNSAGILQVPVRPFELSMDVYDEVVRVNQRGTYLACVVFGRAMVARRNGSIVNIASISGMTSMPLHAYAPSKKAVISITENLAVEWGPANVRVNAVSPGYVTTPPLLAAIERGQRDADALARNAALGRLIEPAEIAAVVAFLCSPTASAVTGATIPVDGGCIPAMSWAPYGGVRPPGN